MTFGLDSVKNIWELPSLGEKRTHKEDVGVTVQLKRRKTLGVSVGYPEVDVLDITSGKSVARELGSVRVDYKGNGSGGSSSKAPGRKQSSMVLKLSKWL